MGKACWLAQLRSTVKDDLNTDFEEAMDFCEEAARLARASSAAALNLANEIREPGGPVQVCNVKIAHVGKILSHMYPRVAQAFFAFTMMR